MKLNKTTRLSLVEQVTTQIGSLIESGQWPVGYRIPAEPYLVEELGVSRNTLREAIRALVHSGLLKTKPGDGTFVISSSILGVALQRRLKESNLLETLEVRHALERETALLAAVRHTTADLENIKLNLAECEGSALVNDYAAFIEADIKLHRSIVKAAHNQLLMDLYEHVAESVRLSIGNMITNYQPIPHSNLVHAIIEKKPEGAAAAVDEYIQQFKDRIQATMEDPQ
ncbi:FadR family transcriptional regulator [Peribacillus psychrosaccharolyticus]|uniref:FadR family transcriptional regulator n=1 Tax=Peribacillus psychrosaccharolyticus TaxID=1407 RepID=A0A974NNJ7_PERPY|nr:FadR/GntR family transcriptional regulator [Peribacillus psychrosaccharolyticus]MEC2054111.1 FadR/GntR family transcriptional regulator [Peribacillus psychrosaccharolyticus]MED3742268.1 FadR/GntR family transcriptional regulator [Peribacillus psychrosaccharolyticus]QQT01251.1 FadR family transcriptional regulator [Peribacillus psychrosaccharolyticus]